jgi:F0F1-type ATP synthase assembly protein I
MGDKQPDNKPQSAAILWARYSGLGFIIPASVFIGWLLGKLLDHWLHTRWLFLVGIILGAILGFVDVIRTVLRDKDLKTK